MDIINNDQKLLDIALCSLQLAIVILYEKKKSFCWLG